jgi:hypothetical protein
LGAVLEEGAKAVGVAEAEAGAEVLCSIPIANQGGVTFEREGEEMPAYGLKREIPQEKRPGSSSMGTVVSGVSGFPPAT